MQKKTENIFWSSYLCILPSVLGVFPDIILILKSVFGLGSLKFVILEANSFGNEIQYIINNSINYITALKIKPLLR